MSVQWANSISETTFSYDLENVCKRAVNVCKISLTFELVSVLEIL